MMKRILGGALCALFVFAGCSTVDAQIIDDFSGDLSNWTSTVILDAENAGANTAAFVINAAGQLELETTVYDGIEQYAFIYNGLSLNVGDEVVLDVPIPVIGNRNLGLYVGGSAPVPAVFDVATRADYITCYSGTNFNIATRGFDGTTEYGNTQSNVEGNETIFIAQPAANTFEVGTYSPAGERLVFETRTPAFANTATFVGIYADVREAGTLGTADNFRIQPIPAGVLKGDIDLNGEVNFLDINPFIAVLSGGGDQAEADCNCDGAVDFLDIQSFIDILAGQ